MIQLLTMPFLLNEAGDRFRPASETGREVDLAMVASFDSMRRSWTFGEAARATLADLQTLAEECSQTGWDGYGATPIGPETLNAAERLVKSLPFDLPKPEASASPVGDIALEWAQTPRRIVSVAISGNGQIHFASLNGQNREFGSMPFDGTFSPRLAELIRNVLG